MSLNGRFFLPQFITGINNGGASPRALSPNTARPREGNVTLVRLFQLMQQLNMVQSNTVN